MSKNVENCWHFASRHIAFRHYATHPKYWYLCSLPKTFVPKNLPNGLNLPSTICQKFSIFYTVKKRRITICQNDILTTLTLFSRRVMTYKRTIEGRAKVCEQSKHRATPGREAGVVRQIVQKMTKYQFGKSWVGKLSSANHESANRPLANRYPPKIFRLFDFQLIYRSINLLLFKKIKLITNYL